MARILILTDGGVQCESIEDVTVEDFVDLEDDDANGIIGRIREGIADALVEEAKGR